MWWTKTGEKYGFGYASLIRSLYRQWNLRHPYISPMEFAATSLPLVSPIGLATSTLRDSYRQWDQQFSVHISLYHPCQWRDQPVSPLPLTGHALPPKPTTTSMQIRDPLCKLFENKLFENRSIYIKKSF